MLDYFRHASCWSLGRAMWIEFRNVRSSMDDLRSWRSNHAAEILGESPAIRRALQLVRRVAGGTSNVLLLGETGTGKELFARAVHAASPRAARPFVAVNCAALPENLIESELFGHVRGAFTGAATPRAGRFVAAAGGTIFLDEIGELPLAAQAKLLRVLEQRTICPVGVDAETPIDVRVVAATHRNLAEMVARGTFRADLYFRLAVLPIELPPLRVRASDLQLLAEHALRRVVERGGPAVRLDASALDAILSYNWPGNVRELNHRIERAAMLADGDAITSSDLQLDEPTLVTTLAGGSPVARSEPRAPLAAAPRPVLDDDATLDLKAAIEGLERRMIREALERAHGNRTEAAALLGLNRTTLVEKLRRYG